MSEKLVPMCPHKLLRINWTDSTKVNKHATLQELTAELSAWTEHLVLSPSTEFCSFRNATTLYYYGIPKDPNTTGISSSVRIT